MKPTHADLLSAISFAARKHRAQRRKDAEASPYINHPIALAHMLATASTCGTIVHPRRRALP